MERGTGQEEREVLEGAFWWKEGGVLGQFPGGGHFRDWRDQQAASPAATVHDWHVCCQEPVAGHNQEQAAVPVYRAVWLVGLVLQPHGQGVFVVSGLSHVERRASSPRATSGRNVCAAP